MVKLSVYNDGMKLKINYPFNEWKSAYLVTNRENRKMVILYTSHSERTTISYARYILSIKHKRKLNKNEEADHINNNKTDDSIRNLQILTKEQNNKKRRKNIKINFVCPICGDNFKLEKRLAYNKVNPACSRKCGYVKTSIKLKNNKIKLDNDKVLGSSPSECKGEICYTEHRQAKH
jgi:endogenous inhibitor of DNA gyrase (YacG/DUF329 family)